MKREEIQDLISTGRLAEALNLLVKYYPDGILLQGQYASARRENNMGLLDGDDWRRTVARITHAVLEIARDIESSESLNNGSISQEPEIYLAFHQNDFSQATKIKDYLLQRGINNINYLKGGTAGEEISRLVSNKLRNANFVIPIISTNSLREGWEGLQNYLDIFSNALVQKNSIPLALDFSFAEPDFIDREVKRLDEQLDNLSEQVQQYRSAKTSDHIDQLKEANVAMLRNNLPKIVQRLRNANVIDISGQHFESGMNRVLQTIQSTVADVQSVYH